VKYLVLIGDGMADHPLGELGGKTPLEAASTPAMDELARRGVIGQYCPIPDGLPPGSDIGNLSLFGYNPREVFTGRAPIEAASQGIHLGPEDVAFRCNLVTLTDGVMADFTAGHISTEEAAELIAFLNDTLGTRFGVRFNAGVSYRHLAVFPGSTHNTDALARATCEPPHNITGRPCGSYLPCGEGGELLRAIMVASQEVLAGHPINQARKAAGKLPATSVWLWGQGMAPKMASFRDTHGLSGAVISAVDLVRGIGVCAGMEIIRVPGATGWLDTHYEGKVAAALDALQRHDVAYIHVEAPDETAHQGRTDLKIQAITDFDARVVAPCLEYASHRDDLRLLVAPDHFTLISTKTHAGGPVPFGIAGPGIPASGAAGYSEGIAAFSGILIPEGYTLVRRFFGEAEIRF